MNLKALGWNSQLSRALAEQSQPQWIPGRVVSEHRGVCILVTEQGELPASVAGRMEHLAESAAELPKIGDWVAVAPQPGENKGVIHWVLPRKSYLGRKVPGRVTTQQILATNVDLACIVQALDNTFRIRRLERFLTLAHEGGIRPVILLNKLDLCPDPAPLIEAAQKAAPGVTLVQTSAETRRGIKALSQLIRPAETVVFLGSSGVGKSSLINRLCGEEYQSTIEVRESDSKGRHTTTSRELIPLPGGGLVIDTPGLRELQLWVHEEALEEAFPEITRLAEGCRFRDCCHENEPGCAVRVALEAKSLPKDRYDSFQKLRKEQVTWVTNTQERAQRIRPKPQKAESRSLRGSRRDWEED